MSQNRRQKRFYFFLILLINDAFFLCIAFLAAFLTRFGFRLDDTIRPFISNYFMYSVAGIAIILLLLAVNRMYNLDDVHPGTEINIRIIMVAILGIFAVSTLNFYIDRDGYLLSRAWLIYIGIYSFVFLAVGRVIARRTVNMLFNALGFKRNVIVIGINEEGRRVANTFSRVELDNAEVVGFADKRQNLEGDGRQLKEYGGFDVLGPIDDIRSFIPEYDIDTVVISSPDLKYEDIQALLDDIKDFDLEIIMSPSLFEFSVARMKMFDYSGVPLIQIGRPGRDWKMKAAKSVIDYTVGFMVFIFFLLILPLAAIAIKIDSRGPVFFKQERYGEDFKKIMIYKFRTMVQDAEKRKDIMDKIYNRDAGFKIKDDPRITSAGRFLRKTSLDEFPQIINVMKGELSLVGPRALVIQEGDQLEDWEKKRMSVKQGITGLWQISGRNDLNYEERIRLDLFYIHNWSLVMEIKIIFFTILRVLFRKGAY
jgi:exopolysaccharide biosynthesis polyprenyl glycosylphosphotransferase